MAAGSFQLLGEFAGKALPPLGPAIEIPLALVVSISAIGLLLT